MDKTEYEKFKTQVIYLWEDENELFIKSVPGKGYFAKMAGLPEYPIPANSDSVTRAVAAMQEVSEAEYQQA